MIKTSTTKFINQPQPPPPSAITTPTTTTSPHQGKKKKNQPSNSKWVGGVSEMGLWRGVDSVGLQRGSMEWVKGVGQ